MAWSFKEASRVSYLDQIDFNYEVEVTYKPLKTFGSEVTKVVPLVYQGDLAYYPNSTNKEELKHKVEIYDIDIDSLSKTNSIGRITLQERNITKELLLYPSLDGEDLYNSHATLYQNIKIGVFVGAVLLIFLITFIAIKIKRKMRRSKRIF
jgi:D-alanyl-D-alanine carboxypeptidase